MNAVETNEQLHELQCKVKCFCCIGKYVLLSLLRWMLKNVDIAKEESLTDPCEVFPKVLKNFQAHYNLRKEIKSLDFNNNKHLITSSGDLTDIKPKIKCNYFDITLLCDFLSNIPIFASNSKPYVPLKRDRIIHSVKIPCTSLKVCCGICLKCFLCFHCCTYKANKKHVLMIKALKDGYSHLVPEVCQKIETNPSEQVALDFHRNTKDGTDAIEKLLTFLLTKGEINQKNYDIKKLKIELVRLTTKDFYWNNFAGLVNLEVPYLRYSCPVNVNYSLLKLGQNEISVLLERFEMYDSECYKSFRENFMRKVRKLLTNKLTASGRIVPFQIKLKEMDVYIEKSNYIKATLHIESRENIVPDCYTEMDSVESQNLRSELQKVCEDELNKILENANITVSVDCRGCKFASIHIYYKIYNHKITLTNGLRDLIKDGFRKVISMPSVLKILENHDLHFCTVNVSFEDSTQEFVVGFTVVSDDKTALQLIEDDLVEIKEKVKREIQKDFADIFMKKQKQKGITKAENFDSFIQGNQLDRTEDEDLIERINERKEAETRLKSVEAVEACYIAYIASRNRIKNLLHDELRRSRMAEHDWCNICATSFCEWKTTAINSSKVKELLHKDRTIFDDLERSLAACDDNDLKRIIFELEGNFSIEHRYYILERVKGLLKDKTMDYQKHVIYRFLSLIKFLKKPATSRLLSVVDIELSNSWQAGVFVVPHDFFTILNNTEVIKNGDILKIKHFLSVIRSPSMKEVKVAFEKWKYELI
ncbi:uncharacterized protein LOC130641280 [Hydractinia symbiolongicarpus]|uniref:uncharacterized protein LOC130641280 n=1 Tax=Hydractinia symbiolongicarpus TaxID=13093 RepID=UPI00254DDDE2|nr:uncharacterized protein LOC130641280 [Hydractinia symbiolongicarpus]